MTNKGSYRKVLGEKLKEFRQSMGLSAYKVAQMGKIRIDQVVSIESGDKNYTIDAFLGYISGCNLYMYFAEKENDQDDTNFEDLIEKGKENYPER